MSEVIDIFVKLSNFIPYVPGVGLLTPCSVPRGVFLYTMIVPREGFAPFKLCTRGLSRGEVVMDEIDTCILNLKIKIIILR